VRTLLVGTESSVGEQSFSGDVHARHEIPLGFRIGGKLVARLADVGATAKAGQTLARLDPADVALQAAQSEAQRVLAEAEVKRFRELRTKNFISQAALDAHEAALKTAQAQAGLARNQEDYAVLRAAAPGVVAAVLAEPGQVIGAGAPVMVLARAGKREVAISIPESTIGRFKVGDVAEVRLWANATDNPDKLYRGRLRELSPAADAVTRTYAARVSLLDADPRVMLGMTAKVSFRGADSRAVMIPATAIIHQDGQPAVWLVSADGTVSLRPVKVLAWRDDRAVIGDGLKTGERIIGSGVHKLHAGEKVMIEKAAK